MNQGRVLAVNTAITSLIEQRVLKDDPLSKSLSGIGELPAMAHPLEKAVYATAAQPGGQKISDVRLGAKSAVEQLANQLKRKGLRGSEGLWDKKNSRWPSGCLEWPPWRRPPWPTCERLCSRHREWATLAAAADVVTVVVAEAAEAGAAVVAAGTESRRKDIRN